MKEMRFKNVYNKDIVRTSEKFEKHKRLNRLDTGTYGTLIILHPLNTQFDVWYESMMKLMTVEDIVHVHSIDELKRMI